MTGSSNKTKNLQLRIASQAGDTLIEVSIAIIIMGLILFSAYTLGSKAFQLGQVSKERSQASQIIQSQAEGLTALRDRSNSWDGFHATLDTYCNPDCGNGFHLERDAGKKWQPAAGSWDPWAQDKELPDGLYEVRINGSFVDSQSGVADSDGDKLKVSITVTWERSGGGTETSTLYLNLVDRKLILPEA